MGAAPEDHPPAAILPPRPLLLAGPTAVGKSEIAARLAEKLGGEIISVDSMQVYRGLDIGTAKPSPEERARVPHHLIDVVDLTESFDAARFIELAHRAVADIQARGRLPILCGGTGLYFKVFLEGLTQAPSADATLRAALAATPLPELLRELAERDPVTYDRIDRQNPRRIIRAIEIIRLTGQPFSARRADWQPATPNPQPAANCIGLTRSPADLQQRIDARVDAMFRRGWVAETEALLKCGLAQNQTAMQALGYRQIVEHLRGERSLPETIALVKLRTRQFAKRQMTWFRRQLRLTWIALEPHASAEAAVQFLVTSSTHWASI
jgi:tRNA dimethylallyltransferase